jgi:hypothetical protein
LRRRATLWPGFAADLHAGNLVPADIDRGPVSPGLHTRLAAAPCGPNNGRGPIKSPLSVDRADDRGPVDPRQQTARLDALTGQITRLAPAIAALDKQNSLTYGLQIALDQLAQHGSQTVHPGVEGFNSASGPAWVVIAFLTVVAAALHRVITRYVHDANRRRRILVVQRILVWLPIVLAIAFAFASDLSSLATYLGLLTAGIAVALQNVILAVIGYFLLVGKLGLRIGDRV